MECFDTISEVLESLENDTSSETSTGSLASGLLRRLYNLHLIIIELKQQLTMDSQKSYAIAKSILRCSLIIVNVLYAIPTYLVWMAMLQPLRHWNPNLFYDIEEILYCLLNKQVCFWCWTAGYTVSETGDDVTEHIDDECIVLPNHQSTADVPLLMSVIGDNKKWWLGRKVYWVMDDLFRCTPFGWISSIHGDFFIKQGRATRPAQLNDFGCHLQNVYSKRGRKWIFLFPEGGFLRKRLKRSQEYAVKHGYPILQYTTLPRMGAMQVILDELSPSGIEKPNGNHVGDCQQANDSVISERRALRWVIDATICYPGGKPLDCFCVLFAHRPPCETIIHYRRRPASEVPRDEDKLMKWLYDRWTEKDQLLGSFYASEETFEGRRPLSVCPVQCILVNLLFIVSTYFHLRMICCSVEYLRSIFY